MRPLVKPCSGESSRVRPAAPAGPGREVVARDGGACKPAGGGYREGTAISGTALNGALVGLAFVVAAGAAEAVDGPSRALAFPGAQGFGAETAGGRGGRIVKVVNLDPAGEGSLRWALEDLHGPRIVVFEVGGVIDLDRQVRVGGKVTIAGQTAPGEGITVRGGRLVVVGDDVIVRGLRLRPGDGPGQDPSARDAISVGIEDGPVRRVIVDHNSLTWATDENAATWYDVSDVTFSNNIIAEGLSDSRHAKGDHSMGMLIGDGARRVSAIGNLLAHNRHRNPTTKAATEIEILNNLVYNSGPNALEIPKGAGGPMTAHAVGNVFIAGPDTVKRAPIRLGDAGPDFAYFLADNIGLTRPIPGMPETAIASGDGLAAGSRGPDLCRQ